MTHALLALLVSAAPSVSQAWKVSAGDWSGVTPRLAATDDAVLFDTYVDLRLIRVADGKLVRKISKRNCFGAVIDLKIESGLAVMLCESPRGEGSAAADLHSTLAAVDLKTGKTRWSRDGAIPAPVWVEGALVVFADAEKIVAVDLTLGKPLWSGKGLRSREGVGVGGGIAAVINETTLTAVSINDGTPKWSSAGVPGPQAAPLVAGDSVYVVHKKKGEGHRLTALASADGKLRWSHDFKGESLFFQPVISGELVLVVGMGEEVTDGHLWALKKATGEPAWNVPWPSDANGHDFRPTPSGDAMLAWRAIPQAVGTYELCAFDPASGTVKWKFAPTTDEKFSFSRPLRVGAKVIYGDGDSVRGLKLPK